jgi:transposase InsO family protein
MFHCVNPLYSDQGSQYASNEYQAMLRQYRIQTIMSQKGNYYDNACAESFHSIIKKNRFSMKPLQQETGQNKIFLNTLNVFATMNEFIPRMCTCHHWSMEKCIHKAKRGNASLHKSGIRDIFPLEKGKGLPNRSSSQETTKRSG